MPIGRRPVRPRIDETPVGVIFETLRVFQLAVYTLLAPSSAIPCGQPPVVPSVEATPAGVILVTLLVFSLAV